MPGVPARGQGWLRDLPDFRDFTIATPEVREALTRLRRRRTARSPKVSAVSGREYLAPPAPFGGLRSTSAEAVAALIGCFERRATGRAVEYSPLFLYYTARKLAGLDGDNGVGLRTTLRAAARFGCPPTRYGPQDAAEFDVEPAPFAYGFQRELTGLRYVRLDPPEASGAAVLAAVKALVAAGFACVCGCVLPTLHGGADGELSFPTKLDGVAAATALVVTGFDDDRRIRSTRGALEVWTTLGPEFGDGGFGRLPYRFVEDRLACDFWTLLKPDWLDSGEFERPVLG